MTKTILKTTFFLLVSGFAITSCSSSDSETICDLGYKKDSNNNCSIPWSGNFVGANLASQDICTGNDNGTFIYNTTITMDNPTTLSTRNLFGYTNSNIIKLKVISPTEISMDFTDASNRVFKGTGTKTGNKLTIDFTVDFPNNGLTSNICSTVITYPNKD